MQSLAVFNIAEAFFWMAIALAIAVRARRAHPDLRRIGFIVAAAFVAFAGTDLIEIKTGAWYRPLWLLVYNAVCIAFIVGCYAKYLLLRKSLSDHDP